MKNKPNPSDENQPDIAKFLLKDTKSLRNEINFTPLEDMVHPLTFTYDHKKDPNMHIIPVLDKYQDKEFRELFDKLVE